MSDSTNTDPQPAEPIPQLTPEERELALQELMAAFLPTLERLSREGKTLPRPPASYELTLPTHAPQDDANTESEKPTDKP